MVFVMFFSLLILAAFVWAFWLMLGVAKNDEKRTDLYEKIEKNNWRL